LLYTCFYVLYQFVLGKFVLETFYYFAHLSVIVYLLVPLLVGTMVERRADSRWLISMSFGVGLAAVPFLFTQAPRLGTAFLDSLRGSLWAAFAYLAICAVFLAVLWRKATSNYTTGALALAAALLLQFPSFVESAHRYVFDSSRAAREYGVYRATIQYLALYCDYDRRDAQLLLWIPKKWPSLVSLSFSTLAANSLGDPWATEGMPLVGERERKKLRDPATRYLLLLSEREEEVAQGRASLVAEGIQFSLVRTLQLGDHSYSVVGELIEIRH
jgi:hypothetical protein